MASGEEPLLLCVLAATVTRRDTALHRPWVSLPRGRLVAVYTSTDLIHPYRRDTSRDHVSSSDRYDEIGMIGMIGMISV